MIIKQYILLFFIFFFVNKTKAFPILTDTNGIVVKVCIGNDIPKQKICIGCSFKPWVCAYKEYPDSSIIYDVVRFDFVFINSKGEEKIINNKTGFFNISIKEILTSIQSEAELKNYLKRNILLKDDVTKQSILITKSIKLFQ